jgi:3-hexulose-6-phosphate synthase/6-phospho-3-hexuloisomerase
MVHTGIDQQMAGKDVFGDLRVVSGAVDLPIAVGGGLSPENVAKAVAGGGEIIIVGGAITKSPDAGKIAAEFKKRLTGKGTKAVKKEESVDSILSIVSTSNVSDAMHRRGEMHGLRPV